MEIEFYWRAVWVCLKNWHPLEDDSVVGPGFRAVGL